MFTKSWTIPWLGVLVLVAFFEGCASNTLSHHPRTASASARNVPILLYHHVGKLPAMASRSQRRWTLSPKKFETQMEWMAAHGFQPITMAQLLAHLKHGQSLPAKPIIITFDDGWKDQYDEAFPILKKHGFTATFFVITGSVGHSAYMSWEQLQEMSAVGMDIQSHSKTHRRISTLPREQARQEIIESKQAIESRLNKPVVVFAYPYGSYDDDVIALLKAAGWEGAATISGLNGGYFLRSDKSYILSRYALESDENLESIARLKGFNPK